MIPKIIHYCWIGNNPLTPLAKKCIDSWHKIMPEYEIKLWNEQNYDCEKNNFMKNAYKQKKWAFVSDYMRFDVLYQYGGLFFDTDVEVLKSFDDFLKYSAFCGFENSNFVNPGLVIGGEKNNKVFLDVLDLYNNLPLQLNEKILQIHKIYPKIIKSWKNTFVTSPVMLTNVLLNSYGLEMIDSRQTLQNIEVFPSNYFAPKVKETNFSIKNDIAYSIHWYAASWIREDTYKKNRIRQFVISLIGEKYAEYLFKIRRFLKKSLSFLFKWL